MGYQQQSQGTKTRKFDIPKSKHQPNEKHNLQKKTQSQQQQKVEKKYLSKTMQHKQFNIQQTLNLPIKICQIENNKVNKSNIKQKSNNDDSEQYHNQNEQCQCQIQLLKQQVEINQKIQYVFQQTDFLFSNLIQDVSQQLDLQIQTFTSGKQLLQLIEDQVQNNKFSVAQKQKIKQETKNKINQLKDNVYKQSQIFLEAKQEEYNLKKKIDYLKENFTKQSQLFFEAKKVEYNQKLKQIFQDTNQSSSNDNSITQSQLHPNTQLPQTTINQSEIQLNKDITTYSNNLPIILLLGCPGVGKTTLMSKLFPKQQIEEFKLFYHKQLNCNIVDTRGFDFTTSIDSREEQIALFQSFFNKYPNQISDLFIIVNFERTDLMKSKIKEVYSYFLKFSNKITIVITQFHISEDKQEDMNHLKNNLSYYKAKKIIFIGDNTNEQQLLKEFEEVKLNLTFDLKDTIFENAQEQMDQILQGLQKQFIKL